MKCILDTLESGRRDRTEKRYIERRKGKNAEYILWKKKKKENGR